VSYSHALEMQSEQKGHRDFNRIIKDKFKSQHLRVNQVIIDALTLMICQGVNWLRKGQ
jgi:hypothetical protein